MKKELRKRKPRIIYFNELTLEVALSINICSESAKVPGGRSFMPLDILKYLYLNLQKSISKVNEA